MIPHEVTHLLIKSKTVETHKPGPNSEPLPHQHFRFIGEDGPTVFKIDNANKQSLKQFSKRGQKDSPSFKALHTSRKRIARLSNAKKTSHSTERTRTRDSTFVCFQSPKGIRKKRKKQKQKDTD